LVGCLLNLRAVLAAVSTDERVAIICSGTNGRPALEDVYVAGRLVAALGGVPSDAARVGYGSPLEPLAASEDAAQLRATGQERDIAWCARESVLEVVPEVWCIEDGASVVGPAGINHRGQSMKTAQEFA
jgi:phosphosulfolactate phosphohydrolase-like enzyme